MTKLPRSKITSQGRITIPVDIRERFGFQPGDVVVFEERNGCLTLRLPQHDEDRTLVSLSADEEDPSKGVLAQYAYTRYPDPAEERRWVAQHIAETADIRDPS